MLLFANTYLTLFSISSRTLHKSSKFSIILIANHKKITPKSYQPPNPVLLFIIPDISKRKQACYIVSSSRVTNGNTHAGTYLQLPLPDADPQNLSYQKGSIQTRHLLHTAQCTSDYFFVRVGYKGEGGKRLRAKGQDQGAKG